MLAMSNTNTVKLPEAWVFYLSSFISYFYNGIIGPLFVIYLLSINLNAAQIGVILSVQRIATIIFEIPTGVFADRHGRKKSLLISFFLFSLLSLIWFFTQNFYLLICLSVMGGFAYTFQSGAKESLLIDSLNLKDNDIQRNKIFARLSVIGYSGFLLGGLAAAGLAFYFLKSIWLVASFLNLILFLLFLFFVQEKKIRAGLINKKSRLKEFLKATKNNFNFIVNNKIDASKNYETIEKSSKQEKGVEAAPTPAEKAPVKKAPAEKAPVKKAPAKKAPVKKAPAKKAPVKKAPAKKAPVKKTTK